MDHAFLVVDIGSAFVTNNNKTGVNDPKAETKKVMKALPDIWMALASNLPKDYEAVLSEFRARRDKAAADREAAKAAKAAKAAAAAVHEKASGAAAVPAPGGAAGCDDGEQQPGRSKRKAAMQAAQRLVGADDVPDFPAPPPPKKPKAKAKPSASTAAPAVLAEKDALKKRVAALEAENRRLRAQLVSAGIIAPRN